MCLIAVAPKGTNKYSEFFLDGIRESARTNRDGFGYAYKIAKTNTVFYNKGFMNIEQMINDMFSRKIGEEDELIVHLRLKSAGTVTDYNTHPFEINYKSERECSLDCKPKTTIFPLMFHNGTFMKFKDVNSDTSDTYNFANNFMKIPGVWKILKDDVNKFKMVFKDVIDYNKLVFISRETDLIFLGDFSKEGGYIWSNVSYKRYGTPYRAPVTVVNPTDNAPTINTKDIKITNENKDHFIVKSTCRCATGTSGKAIEVGEQYTIKSWIGDNTVLEYINNKSIYQFISIDTFKSVFIIIPKEEYRKTYIDYLKLKQRIQNPTKSGIKKIYNKILNVSGRKNIPETVDIKYKEQRITFKYDAILMYLEDNVEFIDKFNLSKLIRDYKAGNEVIKTVTKGSEDLPGDPYNEHNYLDCMC